MRGAVLLLVATSAACSTEGGPSSQPSICEPGEQRDCKCLPDLRPGIQACAAGASSWGECACGAQPPNPTGEGEGEGEGESEERGVGEE